MNNLDKAMKAVIDEAKTGIEAGDGGPFGAAVIKDGEIISQAHNTVLKDNDPTAHAEVNALRLAAKKLKTHELKGCILVASSEPCPMCLASSYWAGVEEIHFALKREVAEKVGFRDIWIGEDIAKPMSERKLKLIHKPDSGEAEQNFTDWVSLNGALY